MRFHLPKNYRENPGPVYFLDDATATRDIVFQPDVYAMAEYLAEMILVGPSGASIVDVGCGWGEKLRAIGERHPNWFLIGIDYGDNIEHCKRTWPGGAWFDRDLELIDVIDAREAVLVCSDVIEHLVDPTNLLNAIRNSGASAVVLSTPERNVEHGWGSLGPPPNLAHVREWTADELNALLRDHGITPRFHGLTRGNDQGWAMGTQIVIAEVPE